MGMYLDVNVIYGVAWRADEVPAAAWPEYPEGSGSGYEGEQIEDGEPCGPGGAFTWGSHGNTLSDSAERHLSLNEAPGGSPQGHYALRMPTEFDIDKLIRWDAMIIDYCASLGMTPEQIPAPGWLALASFG